MRPADNSLLQQFIPEARDLIDQAGRSLLALEREPGKAEPANALFRAMHTLKGTSGLLEVAPLTRVVHATEDLLSAVQSGQDVPPAELTDLLLDVLDVVTAWVDALAEAGDLPADAEHTAETWVERLRGLTAPGVGTGPAPASVGAAATLPDWVAALPDAELRRCLGDGADRDAPPIAITYSPDAHCFFRGDDPLALMRQIAGLRLLRVEPVERWPSLDAIDPFLCQIRLHAVALAPTAELEHLFRYVRDQVELAVLPPDPRAAARGEHARSGEALSTLRIVLAAQQRLLGAASEPASLAGRLRSAARVLRNALAYAGRSDLATGLDGAAQAALAAAEASPLIEFCRHLEQAVAPVGRSAVAAAAGKPDDAALPGAAETRLPAASTTLRVEQGKIDALINLIGELVVAKNALAYLARRADDGTLSARELAREIKERQALVNRIAEEMQEAVMAVRMLPVDYVFQRFPRLVRDIARRLSKHVELIVEGGETEADKNVIESLADPLIHLIRNSLDHGIEPPDERQAAGKPECGTIRLTASQDNDNVVIRLADDGRGIDPGAVRRKAAEKNLLDPDRIAAMTDDEAVMLVFSPGFSTADAVSDLSGRGVGMDVVRTAVEKAGGRVMLSSRKGQGTTVELTLPLSMAVTRIMTVACGDRLFGIPMSAVVETVRVPRRSLHRFRDQEAFVLRDCVVPVVRLARLLDLPEAAGEEEAVLVVRLNGERIGIVVGAFREGMEVIVKPMEGVLAGLRGFAGTTLLGDGRVLLILDLRELVA